MRFDSVFLDCDGVVTDEHARVDLRVLGEVGRLVRSGCKAAFVTGRSLSWIDGNVSRFLLDGLDSAGRARVALVGEYGARWAGFPGGARVEGIDRDKAVPADAVESVRRIAARFPLLFFDETKETNCDLEVNHALVASGAEYAEAQRQLDDAARLLSLEFPELSIRRTTYAADVLAKGVDKRYAAARALSLVGGAENAAVVGDTSADLGMGEELLARGIAFEFYFVGRGGLPDAGFPVKRTRESFAKGTLEALEGMR